MVRAFTELRWRLAAEAADPSDKLYPCTSRASNLGYQLALCIDSLLLVGDLEEAKWADVQDTRTFAAIACEEAGPDMYHCISGLCFWKIDKDKSDDARSPWQALFCKALPQRCQIRRFLERCMEEMEKNRRLVYDLATWIKCTLLGNYRHVHHKFRPSFATRAHAYTFFSNKVNCEAFIQQYWHLVVFALREQIVYWLEQNPVLRDHLNHSATRHGLIQVDHDPVCQQVPHAVRNHHRLVGQQAAARPVCRHLHHLPRTAPPHLRIDARA
jgi:hypothetical protein